MAGGNGKNEKSNASSALPETGSLRRPHDLDAERNVLGAMLLDNECIPDVLEYVHSREFYSPAHQLVFQGMLDLFNQHNLVDLTMLVDHLRKQGKLDEVGGLMMLANLEQGVLSTGSAPELARIVSGKATLRRLMQAAESILKDCVEEARDVTEQIDVAGQRIFDISQQSTAGTFVSVADVMPEVVQEIAIIQQNQGAVAGTPTGFRDLDRYLNGLHKSDLIVLGARPSVGKTAFALNLARNVAIDSKTPTAIFSLEMSAQQLNKRLLCAHAKMSSYKIQKGMLKDSEFAELRMRATELQGAPIYIDDTPGLSIMQVRTRARRLAMQLKNLGLIIVDYLQLMSGSDRGGREQNRQQEVSEISRGLKALARDLDVPIIALSQLSRNIEQRSGKEKNAEPRLADLRESGAIEQDADIVLFIHRPFKSEEDEKNQKGKDGASSQGPAKSAPVATKIIIGKHRNGPTGFVELLFWPDYTRFYDLAK